MIFPSKKNSRWTSFFYWKFPIFRALPRKCPTFTKKIPYKYKPPSPLLFYCEVLAHYHLSCYQKKLNQESFKNQEVPGHNFGQARCSLWLVWACRLQTMDESSGNAIRRKFENPIRMKIEDSLVHWVYLWIESRTYKFRYLKSLAEDFFLDHTIVSWLLAENRS